MWFEALFERLTCFIPRIIILPPNEGGFRQTPKPWNAWPWTRWPWIRWAWVRRPWSSWPWAKKNNSTSTWVKELLPGNWYFLLPIFMEHEIIPIKVQPKDIRIQSVWTKDGKDLAIGGAIIYYVREPLKAILEVDNYDASIQIIALAVIREWVGKHTLVELRENTEELKKQLLTAVREGSAGWGLKIQSVELTDIGVTRNLRLLTGGDSAGIF